MLSQAQLLDELMGRDRNLAPQEKKLSLHWSDPSICKMYVAGFCPHDLFTNTRSDLGFCEKLHDDKLREEYKSSRRFGTMGYEEEFLRYLQSLLSDVDRRIRRGHSRLTTTQELMKEKQLGKLNSESEREKEAQLTEKVNSLVEQAEKLGCEGEVEEAQGVMKLVDQLKDERDMLTSKVKDPSFNGQEKLMEVCEVCGAFLIIGDAQIRVDDHLQGKQHKGYAQIKASVEEMKNRPWLTRSTAKDCGEDDKEKSSEEKDRRSEDKEKRSEDKEKRSEDKEKHSEDTEKRSDSDRDRRRDRDGDRRDRDSDRRDRGGDRRDRDGDRRDRDGDRRDRDGDRQDRDGDRRGRDDDRRSRDRRDRDRDRRDRDRDRDRHRDRDRDRQRDRSRSRDRDRKRSSRDGERSRSREKDDSRRRDDERRREKDDSRREKDDSRRRDDEDRRQDDEDRQESGERKSKEKSEGIEIQGQEASSSKDEKMVEEESCWKKVEDTAAEEKEIPKGSQDETSVPEKSGEEML